MKGAAAIAVLAAALLAACGGGGDGEQASTPAPAPTAEVTSTAPAPPTTSQPSKTTTENRREHEREHATPESTSTSPSDAPLRVTHRYTCRGKRLRAIEAAGPVEVEPPIVEPGQAFNVTITDPSVKVAVVTLTGVARKPIQVDAHEQQGRLTARLEMPGYAECGNKLLEVEGDLSAEAYVGVSR